MHETMNTKEKKNWYGIYIISALSILSAQDKISDFTIEDRTFLFLTLYGMSRPTGIILSCRLVFLPWPGSAFSDDH
jgi:hypothetical protein